MSRTATAGVTALVIWLLPIYSNADTVSGRAPSGPSKELLESARQMKFSRECQTDPGLVAAVPPESRTPPRAAGGSVPQPIYPTAARRAGREGTVTLLLLVNEEGRVVRALVERSSGHEDLDQAALEITDQWRFVPGQVAAKPHCAWGRFATTFETRAEGEIRSQMPIIPEAEQLIDKVFEPAKYAHGLAGTKLLQGTPDDGRVVKEVAKVSANSEAMAQTKRHWARMWSAILSREELRDVLEFYETPAGKKWLYTYKDFERRATGGLARYLGTTACHSVLASRALAQGKAQRGITTEGVPEQFVVALPAIVERNEAFCACAAATFGENLDTTDTSLRDTLVGKISAEGRCPAPQETSW